MKRRSKEIVALTLPASLLFLPASLLFGVHLVLGLALGGQADAEQPPGKLGASRVLFDFDQPEGNRNWQIVNDGVMGGKSSSKLTLTEGGFAKFAGDLSLENNGGFASVRSNPAKLELKPKQKISLRVRGDGRRYTFNLYMPDRRTAFSYQSDFKTSKGEWIEVDLPLSDFIATSYGRKVEGDTLDPSQVESVGVLLGDKLAGPFELTIDWIKVETVE